MADRRVLIVVHGYPPTFSGGAELRAERTARMLADRGCAVRVFCAESASAPDTGLQVEDRTRDGVPVRRLYFNLAASPDPFLWSYYNPRIGGAVGDVIDEWKPTVVHLFSGYLMSASVVTAALDRGVPVVVSLTDFWWICHRVNLLKTRGARCDGPTPLECTRCFAETYRRYRIPARLLPWALSLFWAVVGLFPAASGQIDSRMSYARQLHRAETLLGILNRATALISPSHFLAETYARHGVNTKIIHTWRQGVALSSCPLKTRSPDLRVGFIGQVKRHKGPHLLLEAWPRLRGERSRRLLLFGSDGGEESYGSQIRQQVQRFSNASWLGTFRAGETWDVLSQIDVLAVPSRWAENSPNSILEAQAMGIPVVGSNLGGIAEMIHHEQNGLLFRVDDSRDLARQLQRLLDEPDLLAKLRKNAMPFRGVDQEVDQILDLYDRLATAAT